MTSATTPVSTQSEPELVGQTVVVIGSRPTTTCVPRPTAVAQAEGVRGAADREFGLRVSAAVAVHGLAYSSGRTAQPPINSITDHR
jgi:hypothetical protein